jgi:hypothetical protein
LPSKEFHDHPYATEDKAEKSAFPYCVARTMEVKESVERHAREPKQKGVFHHVRHIKFRARVSFLLIGGASGTFGVHGGRSTA